MARVNTRKKNARGKVICGRGGCGREVQPGETYYWWKPRYGTKQYRCSDHYPRQSELTTSKLSAVYEAIENAEDILIHTDTVEDINQLVHDVADSVREVADEYREAAENFGGVGEHAERADELEGFADELDNFEAEVDAPDEFDEDEEGERIAQENFNCSVEDLNPDERLDWQGLLQEAHDAYDTEHDSDNLAAVESAREQAQEALSQCPL